MRCLLRRLAPWSRLPAVVPVALLCAVPMCASALDTGRGDVQGFIEELSSGLGFDSDSLGEVFGQVETRQSIIDAMSRPAEKRLTWDEYRAIFITDRRISRGQEVAAREAAALARATGSGVPADVILAIVGVETFYGERTGTYRVIDALSTLAFDYPPRAEFFRKELTEFLLMSREEALDPLQPKGSYAGAMGIPQFMPSSFRAYAVDGSGDGHRDLWSNWDDVFASVANYLTVHGWRPGEPVMAPVSVESARLEGLDFGGVSLDQTVGSLRRRGVRFDTQLPDSAPAVLLRLPGSSAPEYRVGFRNFYVITRYNRSQLYASAVNDLAQALGGQSPITPEDSGPRPWSSGAGSGR